MKGPGTLPLAALAEALLRHGGLTCNGEVETDGEGAVTVRFTVPWQQDPAQVHELYERLRLAAGTAQVRAFAARYGIGEAALQAFLPPPEPSGHELLPLVRGADPESMLGLLRRCVNAPTAMLDPEQSVGRAYDMLREHYGDV